MSKVAFFAVLVVIWLLGTAAIVFAVVHFDLSQFVNIVLSLIWGALIGHFGARAYLNRFYGGY